MSQHSVGCSNARSMGCGPNNEIHYVIQVAFELQLNEIYGVRFKFFTLYQLKHYAVSIMLSYYFRSLRYLCSGE